MTLERSTFGTDFKTLFQPDIIADMVVSIDYRRGSDLIEEIDAVMGGIITDYDDATGIDIAVGDGSFWINADDIDFGSGPVEPEMHDRITIRSSGEVHEVLNPGSLDSEKIMRSIPTIKVVYGEAT